MPGTIVVFDIETQDRISNMPGTDRDDQVCNLQISCLSFLVLDADTMLDPEEAAVEVERAAMVTLWRDEDQDGTGPFEPLFEAFDDAEIIVSYNGLAFDHLVLFKHCRRGRTERHLLKAHDAFARLRGNTRVWFKLDNLLKSNGLETKTANGLEAITMWNEGRREELQIYCEQVNAEAIVTLPGAHTHTHSLLRRTCGLWRASSASPNSRFPTRRSPLQTTCLVSRAPWRRVERPSS